MPSVVIWFCLLSWLAAPAYSDDLLQAYRDALAYDARFTSAQAQYRAELEALPQRRAALLPRLSLDAQDSWNQSWQEQAAGQRQTRQRNLSYGVQLVQPLLRMRSWAQLRQGELQVELAESRLDAARQDLILRLSSTYFDVLHSQDSLRAVSQLHDADAEQRASARKQFELGNVSVADVHEAQARFDRSQAQLIEAETALEFAIHSLANITGRLMDKLYKLGDGIAFTTPQPAKLDDWIASARQNEPEVRAQELMQEIARLELRGRKAEHLPSLDLVASHGMQQQSGSDRLYNQNRSIGLRLSLPLFEGGAIRSAVREARNLLLKAEADLDDARRNAMLEARRAWLGISGGMARIGALEAAERASQSALEANRLGYRLGMRIGLDVLDAQSQLADTRQQLSRARYDTLLAKLQLRASSGNLDASDLLAINSLLERLD